jgi:hypothetical protein
VETFVVRLWLPDRPGALGQVASRIGAVRGDVVGIEILERGGGQAVDELVVELPHADLVDMLVREIRQVDGVGVEEVRRLTTGKQHDPRLDAVEAVAQLVGASDEVDLLDALVAHSRRVIGAQWVAVVDIEPGGQEVVARSGDAPSGACRATLRGRRCRPPGWRWCSGGTTSPSGPGSAGRSPPSPGSPTPGGAS